LVPEKGSDKGLRTPKLEEEYGLFKKTATMIGWLTVRENKEEQGTLTLLGKKKETAVRTSKPVARDLREKRQARLRGHSGRAAW